MPQRPEDVQRRPKRGGNWAVDIRQRGEAAGPTPEMYALLQQSLQGFVQCFSNYTSSKTRLLYTQTCPDTLECVRVEAGASSPILLYPGETCVFTTQALCDAACTQHCVQGRYDIRNMWLDAETKTVKYESFMYKLYFTCPKGYSKQHGNTQLVPIYTTHCSSHYVTFDPYNLRQEYVTRMDCPESVNCSNATLKMLDNPDANLLKTFAPQQGMQMCTFALSADECAVYCKVACKENWAAGIYRRRFAILGKQEDDDIIPVPPYQCPAGAETSPSWKPPEPVKLTRGQVAGIVCGIIAAAILAIVLGLYCYIKKRTAEAERTVSGSRSSGPQRGLSVLKQRFGGPGGSKATPMQ